MQNAAFAAAGLDWRYAAFDVEDVVGAVRALGTLGFAGANVTIPHKQAVVAACDEADGDAVNTLVLRDGRVHGHNTDREILAGISASRACLIGGGGAAVALAPALPADTRRFTRSGSWPPDATGCDLVVNATPIRDEVLVELSAGQTVVDLAYGPEETALVAAARAAGCVVVDGREALVRQGAASFRLWTGARAADRGDAGRAHDLAQTTAPMPRAASCAADPEHGAQPVAASGAAAVATGAGARPSCRDVDVRRAARAGRVGIAEKRVVLLDARQLERGADRAGQQCAPTFARRRAEQLRRLQRPDDEPDGAVRERGRRGVRRAAENDADARPPIVPAIASGAETSSLTGVTGEVTSAAAAADRGVGARRAPERGERRQIARSAVLSASKAVVVTPVTFRSVSLPSCGSSRSGSAVAAARRRSAAAARMRLPGLKPAQRMACARWPGSDCDPGARSTRMTGAPIEYV